MTKEDKELLLKDLSGRLPYGVKCYIPEADIVRTLGGILYDNENTLFDFWDESKCYIQEQLYVSEFKPYLFPLKSVDETLRNEFYTLYDEEFDYVLAEDIGATWDKSMDDFEVKEHKLKIKNLLLNSFSKILRWCYKNHIDVNGLIEKGLVNDATGLNIY